MAACRREHPVTLVLAQVRAGGEQGIGWTYGSPACAAVISGVLPASLAAGYAISALDVARGTLRRSGSAFRCTACSACGATTCRSTAAAASPAMTTISSATS